MNKFAAERAVESLPRLTQVIEDMVHLDGWTPDNLARRLDISRAEVTAHLGAARRARMALASAEESGLTRAVASLTSEQADQALRLAQGFVRPSEIARRLGVKPVYIHECFDRARRKGIAVPMFTKAALALRRKQVAGEPARA